LYELFNDTRSELRPERIKMKSNGKDNESNERNYSKKKYCFWLI